MATTREALAIARFPACARPRVSAARSSSRRAARRPHRRASTRDDDDSTTTATDDAASDAAFAVASLDAPRRSLFVAATATATARAVAVAVAVAVAPLPARALDLLVAPPDIDEILAGERVPAASDDDTVARDESSGSASAPAPEPPAERDVITTASGVAYADLAVGRGEPVKLGAVVVAHVVGTLPNSNDLVFEDTYARGAPLVFEYGIRPPGVCEGLEEAIGTMRAGGRRLVAVPPEVGFGNKVRSIHWSPYDRVGAVNAVS